MECNSITFNLNGNLIQLFEGEFNPAQSLAEFLRSDSVNLKGTKISCGEGGCGSCTVVMSTISSTGEIKHRAVNSCLILLIQVHFTTITTIEFLGNLNSGINPIQASFIKHNATQCGYCTPGFIMATYSLFLNKNFNDIEKLNKTRNDKIDNDGFDIEDMHKLDGNLCRCTGYRSIIDALRDLLISSSTNETNMKVDDHQFKPCDDSISGDTSHLKVYESIKDKVPHVPNEFIKKEKSICIHFKGIKYFIPSNLSEFYRIKRENKENSKIIVGSTEISIDFLKNKPIPNQVYISTLHLSELSHISLEKNENRNDIYLKIGANTPMNDILSYLKECFLEDINKYSHLFNNKQQLSVKRFVKEMKNRIEFFGSNQIRNVASLVGNIAHGGAATDMSNFLLAMKATLLIANVDTNEVIQKEMENDFYQSYRKTSICNNEIITDILIGIPQETRDSENNCVVGEYVSTFKQSRRREDDICIVSSSIYAKIRTNEEAKGIIDEIRVAYSGMSPVPCRATIFENALKGKEFTLENIKSCFNLIDEQFPLNETTPGGYPEFRLSVSKSFLIRFYHQTQRDRNLPFDESAVDVIEQPVKKFSIGGCNCKKSADQLIGYPTQHLSALQQTTGEAIYVDDIPVKVNTLYSYFVTSSIPHGKIVEIDFSDALKFPGVVDKVTKEDVTGKNFLGDIFLHEPVFAEDEVYFVGQPIALIVAKTQEIAKEAAKLVKVKYEELPSVLSLRQAINSNSYFPNYKNKICSGVFKNDPNTATATDDNKTVSFCCSLTEFSEKVKKLNCDHIIEGEVDVNGQSHFYFETCSALIEPSEDNNMTVFTSTQNPALIQSEICRVTNLPSNKINVIVKRLGGGFGGKETRPTVLTNALCVAAMKLKKPVKMTLDRSTDMSIQGQRHPMLSKFKVAFNNDGKIVAIQFDHFFDGGWSMDMTAGVCDRALIHSDSSYSIPNFLAVGHICRTNMITGTAFRGFGTPQVIVAMECAIEKVSRFLRKHPEEVKYANLYPPKGITPYNYIHEDCRVVECWDYVKGESMFNLQKIRENQRIFNDNSKYKKVGVAICPLVFGVSFTLPFLNQGNANVNIYKDGSVKIFHGGCEMGQGVNTKIAQIAASTLGIPLSFIEVSAASTDHAPNSTPTSASSGADLNGAAVKDACEKLNKNLIEIRQDNNLGWKEVCMKAYMNQIDLSAHGHTKYTDVSFDWSKQQGKPYKYFAYGCSACEVEVDLLTGDHQLKKVHLVLDVGKSLNEALDVGQIEGGLMQGIGWLTLEEVVRGDNEEFKWVQPVGKIQSNGAGFYKIPSIGDVPHELKIELLKDGRNSDGLFSSKACSESPLCLASSIGMAIVDAVRETRKKENSLGDENDLNFHFPMTAPRIKSYLNIDA